MVMEKSKFSFIALRSWVWSFEMKEFFSAKKILVQKFGRDLLTSVVWGLSWYLIQFARRLDAEAIVVVWRSAQISEIFTEVEICWNIDKVEIVR